MMEKKTCAIIEADLTKLKSNDMERSSVGTEIVKIAKKKSTENANVQYAFVSDNKRKVIIYLSYKNQKDFTDFRRTLERLSLNTENAFSYNEGINVLQE